MYGNSSSSSKRREKTRDRHRHHQKKITRANIVIKKITRNENEILHGCSLNGIEKGVPKVAYDGRTYFGTRISLVID